jgi:uncharacterized membrane protein HdeD (DUF308 family)
MEKEKEIKCSFKFVMSKMVMVAGIIAGALLIILGIVVITADTSALFSAPFVRWYTTDTYLITFSDTKGLSNTDIWLRPHEVVNWQWTTTTTKGIIETNEYYQILPDGFKTALLTSGDVKMKLNNLTIQPHYYCVTGDNPNTCRYGSTYHGIIRMYKSTAFRTNNTFGNQNYRWTFFFLALLMIVFGIVTVMGELRIPLVTTKFTFFYYGFVKGIIYVLVGVLCLGMANFFGLFVAIFMWVVGILNCVHGYKAVLGFNWSTVGARGTTTIVTRREYI